jgi:hypothetical protein
VCGSRTMSCRAAAGPRSLALPAVRVGLPSSEPEPPRRTDLDCPGRARGVPDRTVISAESRSFTDTPHRPSPAECQVRRPCPQCLPAGDLRPPRCSMILTVASESRPSPKRSLREPGHGGHGQGRAATRRTRGSRAQTGPRPSPTHRTPARGRRAISRPLARVTRGQ